MDLSVPALAHGSFGNPRRPGCLPGEPMASEHPGGLLRCCEPHLGGQGASKTIGCLCPWRPIRTRSSERSSSTGWNYRAGPIYRASEKLQCWIRAVAGGIDCVVFVAVSSERPPWDHPPTALSVEAEMVDGDGAGFEGMEICRSMALTTPSLTRFLAQFVGAALDHVLTSRSLCHSPSARQLGDA